jgi:hypothetical protein
MTLMAMVRLLLRIMDRDRRPLAITIDPPSSDRRLRLPHQEMQMTGKRFGGCLERWTRTVHNSFYISVNTEAKEWYSKRLID